jgi:hypothetical protein
MYVPSVQQQQHGAKQEGEREKSEIRSTCILEPPVVPAHPRAPMAPR